MKVLPFAAVLDAKQIARFKNEAQAAAQLQHPNIVPVFAVGVERGVHYYAMQFIDGQPLDVAVRQLREQLRAARRPGHAAAGSETPARVRCLELPADVRIAATRPSTSGRWCGSASRRPGPCIAPTSTASCIAT